MHSSFIKQHGDNPANVFYKGAMTGREIAEYIESLDVGFTMHDMGGGIRSVGYDRDLPQVNESSHLQIGLWSNIEGWEDAMPFLLKEESSVVLNAHDYEQDIWISDTLFSGSALDCINWMVAEGRMDAVCAKYAPILAAGIENGESGNVHMFVLG